MISTTDKLVSLANNIESGKPVKIAIFGLGSVGSYLLDYLASWDDENIEIHVCGRSVQKMEMDVNIVRVGSGIRNNRNTPIFIHSMNLDDVGSIISILEKIKPDFIVNTSRVYSGLKYGSISWSTLRAYGIWSPLSVRYILNIMKAHETVSCKAIVINTSYPDAVNAWLKSANIAFPDFGSGNLNHLVPRIKLSIMNRYHLLSYRALDVVLATSHHHDVLISKEGEVNGIPPLLYVEYEGKELKVDADAIYADCTIPMPVDTKRNIMNASSNFEIIKKIYYAITHKEIVYFHSPGALANIGGYPLIVDFSSASRVNGHVYLNEEHFTFKEMEKVNKQSIALDGIDTVEGGKLYYTDELLSKVKTAFKVQLPKVVGIDDIPALDSVLINQIILPFTKK